MLQISYRALQGMPCLILGRNSQTFAFGGSLLDCASVSEPLDFGSIMLDGSFLFIIVQASLLASKGGPMTEGGLFDHRTLGDISQ